MREIEELNRFVRSSTVRGKVDTGYVYELVGQYATVVTSSRVKIKGLNAPYGLSVGDSVGLWWPPGQRRPVIVNANLAAVAYETTDSDILSTTSSSSPTPVSESDADLLAHISNLANPHQTSLANLTDTLIVSPEEGQLLRWSGTAWENYTRPIPIEWYSKPNGAATDPGPYRNVPIDGTLLRVRLLAKAEIASADLEFDILKSTNLTSWATLFSTNPKITVGNRIGGSGAVFSSPTLSADDVLRYDVVGGACTAGVTILVEMR